jgi:UDP-3-O-[3-hydroxymyristoyl] N-acetylglucosamine deacetylase
VTTLRTPLRRQRTISKCTEVAGFGYWSGRDVRVLFRPASPDTGIVFVRDDFEQPRRIPVHVNNRLEMPRRTSLAAEGATVEMVEHVLAALHGLHVDNCEVCVNSPELPGCDGSSLPFVQALDAVGTVEQVVERSRLVVTEVTRVGTQESWVEARPAPKGQGFSLRYKLDYGPNTPIGKQALDLPNVTPHSFRTELAPARTFIMEEEARWLKERGLGTRVTMRDLLVFNDDGVIDNELRFENECVRHKTLDLLGDLALAGCELVGQFIAFRSGHRLNAELVKVLLAEGLKEAGRRRSA